MSIRRISELPNIEVYDSEAHLSDCLMEVSYRDNQNNYRSAYILGMKLINTCLLNVNQYTFGSININGNLTVENGNIYFNNLTNFNANGENLNFKFNSIDLSANNSFHIQTPNELKLTGNPINLNDNYIIYAYESTIKKPLTAESKVELKDTTNIINAETIGINGYTSEANKNRVVTCELLNATIGNINSILEKVTIGAGV